VTEEEPIAAAPNILLLVVDCLRSDFVFEVDLAHTPTLDALRENGFGFPSAIASTSTTSPSFASLLTGMYPYEHGVRSHSGYRLAEHVTGLAGVLRDAGYHTHAEVSGPLDVTIGLDRGFGSYRHRVREDTVHTAWGRELITRLQGCATPWFLMLHIWCLHKSRQVLPQCDTRAHGRTLYGRALASIDLYLGELLGTLPENTLTVLTGDHGEDIAYGPLDRFQKKLRKKLKRFLVKRHLTSRHISFLYRGCHVGHGYGLYDTLVRVPLVLHHPRLVPRGESSVQVRHIDVAPTILASAGIRPPEEMSGRPLQPIMRGEDDAHRDAYLEAVGHIMPDKSEWLAGIRVDNRYKYIYAPFRGDYPPQLYDLQDDPRERHNVARREPEVAAGLRRRLTELQTDRMVGVKLSPAEQKRVMTHLRSLGYLDD
jgi:arylsulfatase A-like enzyme